MKIHPIALNQTLALACAASILLAACGDKPVPPAPAPPSVSVGTEIDDSVVTARVKSALLADVEIKSFEIKVETRKGQVQLSGFVDTQAHIDNALALVRKIEGVKSVDNGMGLKQGKETVGNAVDDSVVTTRVKSAFLADNRVKSFDIGVITRKGEVQLSGFVDNQTQIDHALVLTRATEGVKSVTNEMSIKK